MSAIFESPSTQLIYSLSRWLQGFPGRIVLSAMLVVMTSTSAADDAVPFDTESPVPDVEVIDAGSRSGNVIRLGTDRFRIGRDSIRFLSDSRSLVVAVRSTGMFTQDPNVNDRPAAVINARTGQTIRQLGRVTNDEFSWSTLSISGDGRRIAFVRGRSPRAPIPWGFPFQTHVQIDIFDTKTGEQIATLPNAISAARRSAAMNYDGTRIVLCGRQTLRGNRGIEVWDTTTGKKLHSSKVLNRHNIDSVAIDRTGEQVLIAGPGDVYLWDLASGEMSVFEEHGATAVAFSLDGKYIGTGRGGAPESRLWDRTTGRKLFQFKISGAHVVSFSLNSRYFVVPSGYSNSLEIRDVRSGELVRKIDTGGIGIDDVSLSPDGHWLAVSGGSPGVGIWDLRSGRKVSENGAGHDQSVRDLRFSPDQRSLVTAGMDGKVIVWDANSGELIHQLPAGSNRWAAGVNYSADGRFVVASGMDDRNRVWDVKTGELLHTLPGHGHTGPTRFPITMTRDGRLVSFGGDATVRVFDVASEEVTSSWTLGKAASKKGVVRSFHSASRLSADGSTLAVVVGKRVQMFDAVTGKERSTFDVRNAADSGFDISPDGAGLSTSRGHYDTATGQLLYRYGVNGGRTADVRFSDNGKWVGVVTRGGPTRLWMVDLKSRQTFQHEASGFTPVAVAPDLDGQRLAVACSDNSVLIWQVAAFTRVSGHAPSKVRTAVHALLKSEEKLKKISGRVLDTSGRPVSGVRVLLRERPLGTEVHQGLLGFDRTSDIAVTWSDGKGRFAFENIPCVGHKRPAYTKDGFKFDVIAMPYEYSLGGAKRRKPLAASWSHVEDGADVELKSSKAASIYGRIMDVNGKPVADAAVKVRYFMSIRDVTQNDLRGLDWPRYDSPEFLQLKEAADAVAVKTDAEGRYSFVNLPAGTGLILEAEHPDYVNQMFYAATVDELDPQLSRRMKRKVQTNPVDATLDPGHHIKVRVVYKDTSEVAKNAVIKKWHYRLQKSEKIILQDGVKEYRNVPNGRFYVWIAPAEDEALEQKYAGGSKTLHLTPEKRQHLVTVRILTHDQKKQRKEVDEFLERIENIQPDSPPRKPRFHFRNVGGDINELRLRSKKLLPGDMRLVSQLEYLEILDLHNTHSTNVDVQEISRLSSMQELDLSSNFDINSGVKHLQNLQHLSRLNLRNTRVGDGDLGFLKELPNLKHIVLSGTNVTNAGLELIGQLKQLQTLKLGDLKVSDSGIEPLMNLPELRGLTLNETDLTVKGLKRLAQKPGFAWVSNPDNTVREYVRRIESGEFRHAAEMRCPGLSIPDRGKFKLLKIEPTTKPRRDSRGYRYHLEFDWTTDENRPSEQIYAKVIVDRGSVFVTGLGIIE